MKRVLVTGATGFVGANLVRRLIQDGHAVHVLVREQAQTWRLQDVREEMHWHTLELADAEQVRGVVNDVRPEWIFHLAAHGAYAWQTDTPQIIATNLTATIQLIDACSAVGFEAFVQTGSSSEYGWKDHAPSETDWLEPNSLYAITKAAATHYGRHISLTRKLPLVTLRLYSAYGAWEEPRRLIPSLIVNGLHGKLPPLTDPEIARDFIFVQDVVEACLVTANKGAAIPPGSVYNLGTGIQTTLREAVQVTRELLDVSQEPVWNTMAQRRWDTKTWVANTHKIRQELGWQPNFSFCEGMQQTVQWFREAPQWLAWYEKQLEVK